MQPKLIACARTVLAVVVALGAAPAPAAADFLVEPFWGWSRNPPQPEGTTAAWHPGGGVAFDWTSGMLIVGGEVGYAPGFFDPPQDLLDLIQTSHVLTAGGAAGITRSYVVRRKLYPYLTAGLGLMRQQARDRAGAIDVTRNDPALDVGGGARWLVKNYLGVRGDLRYFRSLRGPEDSGSDLVSDLPRLGFWRISAGIVLRFGD
jgi:hypothetical protein